MASGLLNTSQNVGGTIGVAVASSIAASHFRTLVRHGYGTAAAFTGGFHWALWVCALTGLAAVPVAFLVIRRARTAAAPRCISLVASEMPAAPCGRTVGDEPEVPHPDAGREKVASGAQLV